VPLPLLDYIGAAHGFFVGSVAAVAATCTGVSSEAEDGARAGRFIPGGAGDGVR
jgi:hypothetical protein